MSKIPHASTWLNEDRFDDDPASWETDYESQSVSSSKEFGKNQSVLEAVLQDYSDAGEVIDAAECPPTFGTEPWQVQGLMAGGEAAMFVAQEGAEDSVEKGKADVAALNVYSRDVVCGLAASGRTPYVLGALEYAKSVGAGTVMVCCVTAQRVKHEGSIDVMIDVPVGQEVIMGSTRMKSATAQKMVCNMITTGAMIRSGKIYENVMVDLKLTNKKLVERARRIIMMFTHFSYEECARLLEEADGHVKTAIVMGLSGRDKAASVALLNTHGGFIRAALQSIGR
jgi:N-acetylmuramic acid 6-phosphate etherase